MLYASARAPGEERWKGFSLVREGQAQIAPSFSPSRFKSRGIRQLLGLAQRRCQILRLVEWLDSKPLSDA